MTTPAIIIANALNYLERPDLESKATNAFYSALRSCHTILKTPRDLTEVYVVGFDNDDGRVHLSISDEMPELREIMDISLWESYTEPTPGTFVLSDQIIFDPQYKNRIDIPSDMLDYYGYLYTKVYTRIGNDLILDGVDDNATCIKFKIVAWPTYTINQFTQAIETNSWIVAEWPQLVQAKLILSLVSPIKDTDAYRLASADYSREFNDFMIANAEGKL